MSELGRASTSPFEISSLDLRTSQKRTQPFAQRRKEDMSERTGEPVVTSHHLTRQSRLPDPFRTIRLPRQHLRSPIYLHLDSSPLPNAETFPSVPGSP